MKSLVEANHAVPETFWLATTYLDFAGASSSALSYSRDLAVTCYYLAAKMEETKPPRALDLEYRNKITPRGTIKRLEIQLIRALRFKLT
jgi:hypothetical protein